MPIAALAPLIVLGVAFVGYCEWDLSKSTPQFGPRWLWAVVIALSVPVGGIAWLMFGKQPE